MLQFNGNDIQQGMNGYQASQLHGKGLKEYVKKYGLMQSGCDLRVGGAKVTGKKLLMIRVEALRVVFRDPSIFKYHDIWRVGGAVDKQARLADSSARALALQHFRASLAIRTGQAARYGPLDVGHQQMIDEMEHCIRRIASM